METKRRRGAVLFLPVLLVALSGCAFNRTNTAQQARSVMVGFPAERALECMGAPDHWMNEGGTGLELLFKQWPHGHLRRRRFRQAFRRALDDLPPALLQDRHRPTRRCRRRRPLQRAHGRPAHERRTMRIHGAGLRQLQPVAPPTTQEKATRREDLCVGSVHVPPVHGHHRRERIRSRWSRSTGKSPSPPKGC